MNTKKHHPNDKLQKSSKLFLQLGLILALIICYSFLEISSLQKTPPIIVSENIEPDIIVNIDPRTDFEYEKKMEPKKNKVIKKLQQIDKILLKDDSLLTTDILEPIEPIDDINKAIDILPTDTPEEPTDEVIPFVFLEQVPIFPGCENLDKETSKQCFTKELSKFVNKKFNTELASELGLYGKQNIYVQFVIDKSGKVTNIMARAPHKKLEKEAIDIIDKLPQMTPGKQRTKPVPVKYTLPIKFEIYN